MFPMFQGEAVPLGGLMDSLNRMCFSVVIMVCVARVINM